MFSVNFYTVSKNANSTARPSGQGSVFDCILKKPSSMVAPVLQLQIGPTAVPSWNYCYISAFQRYYFINNWTALNGGIWEADLSVDVLASYKSIIGDTTFLIERSSAASDGYLTDTVYPASNDRSNSVITKDPTASGTWPQYYEIPSKLDDGSFVLSVINGDSEGYTFFVLSYSGFIAFREALYSSINWYDGGTIADGLKKSIANPMQYINSVTWFPFPPWTGVNQRNIKFGFWDSGVSGRVMDPNSWQMIRMKIANADIPKHPQAASRGQYLNCAPYTKIRCMMNPWGSFEIDPGFVAEGYSLQASVRVDFVTGDGLLIVEAVDAQDSPKELLYMGSAMFGIPIPVTQRSVDLTGAVTAASGVMSAFAGNFIEGAAQALGGTVATAINTSNPSVNSKGTQGSLAALTAPYKFYFEHYQITAEDNNRQGRPLMQNYKPSALGGFMRVVDPDMVGDLGTLGERQQVLGYLSGGFYYE